MHKRTDETNDIQMQNRTTTTLNCVKYILIG